MATDYNTFAKSFAASRKNMKWEEIDYFFSKLEKSGSLLDIGCGSGRLLEAYQGYFERFPEKYIGVDLSKGLLQEARKSYPQYDFFEKNMLEIKEVIGNGTQFESVFLIASFHHLETYSDRQKMMKNLFDITLKGGKVFLTNWALESEVHEEKYRDSQISGSRNEFGSLDFNIQFSGNDRFYHSFSLKELETLALESGFQIIENRLFDSKKNVITILQK